MGEDGRGVTVAGDAARPDARNETSRRMPERALSPRGGHPKPQALCLRAYNARPVAGRNLGVQRVLHEVKWDQANVDGCAERRRALDVGSLWDNCARTREENLEETELRMLIFAQR